MNPHFRNRFHLELEQLPVNIKRPLWTVLIPTYNCANYLEETLQSILQQDPGPEKMEIIVIDDYSTKDRPEKVVNEVGKGRVLFIRQKENVGKVRNYETGLKLSSGKYIHQLHGDDKVRDGFYCEMERIFSFCPEAGAAFCRTIYIDSQSRWTGITGMIQESEGIIANMVDLLYTEQHIQTPSMVVKREVYENLGGFDRRLNCMEDWEMWTRISNYYPIAYSNNVLAEYRSHENNATNLTFNDGSALHTNQQVLNIIDLYINKQTKKNNTYIRNKKQSEFLLLSLKKHGQNMSSLDKNKLRLQILKLNPSLRKIYQLLFR